MLEDKQAYCKSCKKTVECKVLIIRLPFGTEALSMKCPECKCVVHSEEVRPNDEAY